MSTAPPPTAEALTRLYETDETAWLDIMAELAAGKSKDLDYENLQEYLSSMSQRDRRAVFNRLVVLLTHLLKWEFQPDHRSRSWEGTIFEQRRRLKQLCESATLRNHALEMLALAYAEAVTMAGIETGLPAEKFPELCPFDWETLWEG